MTEIPLARFRNASVWRIIPSRFPPIDLFQDVAPAEHWTFLQDFEGRTNERLVEEATSRGYIRPEDRIEKSNSHYIIGPLTHPKPGGSRFSDGTFGVLYGGLDFETTAAEVRAQREEFLRRTSEDAQRLDMRAIVMDLDGDLHDLRAAGGQALIERESSHAIARRLRDAGSFGLVFDSVIRPGGTCVCIFRPNVLSNCRQERHFAYVWDGNSIVDVYEYAKAPLMTESALRK